MKKLVGSVLLVGLLAGAVPAASSCAMPISLGVPGFLRGALSFFSKTNKAGAMKEGCPAPRDEAESSYPAIGRPAPRDEDGRYPAIGRPAPRDEESSYPAIGRPAPRDEESSYPAIGRPAPRDEESRYPAIGRPAPSDEEGRSALRNLRISEIDAEKFSRRNEKPSDAADASKSAREKAWAIKQDLYKRFSYVRDGLIALQVAYAKNRHTMVQNKLKAAMELNKYMEERLNRVYQDALQGLEVDLDKEEKSMKESYDRAASSVAYAAQMFSLCKGTY